MKVLLQDKKTRLFLKEAGSWTSHLDEAFVFINSGKAIDFAFQHELSDVHVLLWFKEQNYSLAIPFQRDHTEEPGGAVPNPPRVEDREQL